MAPGKFRATLEASAPLSPSVKLLRLRLDAPLEFRAGQNLTLKAPDGDGGLRTKPYSIGSSPGLEGCRAVELCVQRVEGGPGSVWLHSLAPGTPLGIEAPFGHFRLKEAPPTEALFVGEGTGVSPLRSMLHELLRGGRPYGPVPVRLFLSRGPAEAFLFEEEWRALERAHPNFRFVPVDGPWERALARVEAAGRDAYLCGLTPFLGEATTVLRARGLAPGQIRFERFV